MTTRKRNKIDDFEDQLKEIDPQIIEELTNRVREELEKDNEKLKEELKKKRSVEKRQRTTYFNSMKKSDLPWFVLTASPVENELNIDAQGLQYEIDWNTPFQQMLVSNKVIGTDDLERVEHWLVEMLHNIIEIREAEKLESGESEYE